MITGVAPNSLTGANINTGTLGTVPDASHLGGSPASAYVKSPPESFHSVAFSDGCEAEIFPAPNAPPIVGNWQDYNSANNSTAAYLRDPFGIVHLKGTIKCAAATGEVLPGVRIFSLPPGYAPEKTENFAVPGAEGITTIAIYGTTR